MTFGRGHGWGGIISDGFSRTFKYEQIAKARGCTPSHPPEPCIVDGVNQGSHGLPWDYDVEFGKLPGAPGLQGKAMTFELADQPRDVGLTRHEFAGTCVFPCFDACGRIVYGSAPAAKESLQEAQADALQGPHIPFADDERAARREESAQFRNSGLYVRDMHQHPPTDHQLAVRRWQVGPGQVGETKLDLRLHALLGRRFPCLL